MTAGKTYLADRSENALTKSAWFGRFWGYTTAFPVQFYAVLRTGHFVSFRARGRNITLEVARDQADFTRGQLVARYRSEAVVDDRRPFGASLMASEEILTVIEPWFKRIESGDLVMEQ